MPVLLTVLLIAFIGMTGLGVDFAFSTFERRALQNAADASALTGAIDLSRGTAPTADVTTIADRNATTSSVDCQYVNTANVDIGPCTGSATGASGVHVTAVHTRDTYFMRVLGIPTVTIAADAIARVSSMQDSSTNPATSVPYEAQNALFIVCGYKTKLVGGGTMNILQGSKPGTSPWNLNPAAFGQEFSIHDPHPEDCGMASASFKGLNSVVGTVTLPAVLTDETGTNAGPTRYAVNGFNGCPAGATSSNVDNCVMILPIAVSSPSKDDLYAVRWLPFWIRQIDSNTHSGTLLNSYNLNDPLLPWTYAGGNTSGITSVRLVH
jgi:Flp pilus assembly protein TadG